MQMSMKMLSFCNEIYMLRGWKDSPGVNIEYKWAADNGVSVLYEGE